MVSGLSFLKLLLLLFGGVFFFFFFNNQREPGQVGHFAKLPRRADPAANPGAFICARLGSGACSRLFPEEKKGSHTKISH